MVRRGIGAGFAPRQSGKQPIVTKVLVVATAPVAREEISSPIENRFGEDAEFRVIPLFAGSNRATTTTDPAGAIEEARRRYGADEVVVVTRVSDEDSWVGSGAVDSARERLDVPLTHLLVA
jgi:hypothetical protein